jgi:hypothetical protein
MVWNIGDYDFAGVQRFPKAFAERSRKECTISLRRTPGVGGHRKRPAMRHQYREVSDDRAAVLMDRDLA